jgi:hypothetical protein
LGAKLQIFMQKNDFGTPSVAIYQLKKHKTGVKK